MLEPQFIVHTNHHIIQTILVFPMRMIQPSNLVWNLCENLFCEHTQNRKCCHLCATIQINIKMTINITQYETAGCEIEWKTFTLNRKTCWAECSYQNVILYLLQRNQPSI